MLNMNNKKVKQRISAAIIVLLVIAMIVPTITSIFYYSTADGTVDVPEGRAEEYYEKIS